MATVTLTIKGSGITDLVVDSSLDQIAVAKLINHLQGLACGGKRGLIYAASSASDPVAAAGTITITHANVTNADTCTIGGVVITAATSGNGTSSWTIGADATADAVAMAACINANTTLNKHLIATSALGVVTLTARAPGSIGNLIALATSDATAFALVQLTGGTGGGEGAVTTYSFGQ